MFCDLVSPEPSLWQTVGTEFVLSNLTHWIPFCIVFSVCVFCSFTALPSFGDQSRFRRTSRCAYPYSTPYSPSHLYKITAHNQSFSWTFSPTLNVKKSIKKIGYPLTYQQSVDLKSVLHLKPIRLWFIMQCHTETWLQSRLGSALSKLCWLKTLILIELFMAYIDWFKAFVFHT